MASRNTKTTKDVETPVTPDPIVDGNDGTAASSTDDTVNPDVVEPTDDENAPESPVDGSEPDPGVLTPFNTSEAPEGPASAVTTHQEGVPKGRILEQDEELTFDGQESNNVIYATEDVYRKIYPMGTRRPTYILVIPKGAPFSPQQHRRLSPEKP